jgi:hypothetical protein
LSKANTASDKRQTEQLTAADDLEIADEALLTQALALGTDLGLVKG